MPETTSPEVPEAKPLKLLQPDQYEERAKVLQYTITFSGAAVAFLITAKEKLGLNVSLLWLKILLGAWGLTIFLGFMEYAMSYHEAWNYRINPENREKWPFSWEYWLMRTLLLPGVPAVLVLSVILTVITFIRS